MRNPKINVFDEIIPKKQKNIPSIKKTKTKNLSPAKKFRLRLRRAKFQRQQQAKDDYFEHDNRDAERFSVLPHNDNKKTKTQRLSKKGRRAQMYIDAYLKTQQLSQNGDTASQEDTQDIVSVGNDTVVKSIVHRATSMGFSSSPMTSKLIGHAFSGKEQAILKTKRIFPTSSNSVKCCCQCACSGAKKKGRRKMSSPYFGDFNQKFSPNDSSNCGRNSAGVRTKLLNKTTTTTHQTLYNASAEDFFHFNDTPANIKLPMFATSSTFQGARFVFNFWFSMYERWCE